MPRIARKYSKTNIYHIIIKGIDNQVIFYDEADKKVFMEKIAETRRLIEYKIFAYCLMNNHVHMVINIQDDLLSKVIQSLCIRYSSYFNKKYMRSGPLFQDRFKSKCVEDQKYFLDVCRYVEQNPEKAGICQTQNYIWSSYHEYIGKGKIIDKDTLLHYFNNNIENYKIFTTKGNSENEYDFLEYELKEKLLDEELSNIIVKKLNLDNINDYPNLSKEEFEKSIEILKNIPYTSINQISRVTRVNRYQIMKLWKRGV